MSVKVQVGEIIILKKSHPCGGNSFEVIRTGLDYRLKCMSCGSQITLTGAKLKKRFLKSSE